MKITSDDIYALLRQGESIAVEMKKCSDKLPRSVWETYSAFANSRGGVRELDDVKEVWLSLPLIRATKSEEGTSKTEDGTSKGDSTVNSTVNSLSDLLDSKELTDIQESLLKKMTENPDIKIAELSTVTGLYRNAVNYQLKKLRQIINIERSGSAKKGSWKLSLN